MIKLILTITLIVIAGYLITLGASYIETKDTVCTIVAGDCKETFEVRYIYDYGGKDFVIHTKDGRTIIAPRQRVIITRKQRKRQANDHE